MRISDQGISVAPGFETPPPTQAYSSARLNSKTENVKVITEVIICHVRDPWMGRKCERWVVSCAEAPGLLGPGGGQQGPVQPLQGNGKLKSFHTRRRTRASLTVHRQGTEKDSSASEQRVTTLPPTPAWDYSFCGFKGIGGIYDGKRKLTQTARAQRCDWWSSRCQCSIILESSMWNCV